jgi:hypothetical protein
MTSLTPPFPEYVSGHSTFSAAGARVLRMFTGSDLFGAQVTIPAGSSRIEPRATPAIPMVLTWPTFTNALDEAGNSRRQGGIHFLDAGPGRPRPGRRGGGQRLGQGAKLRQRLGWVAPPVRVQSRTGVRYRPGRHQRHAARRLGAFSAVDPSPSCQPKPANYR